MGHIYLVIAVVAEVIATSALKVSEEFSKPIPTIIVIIGYGIAFYLLTLVLRTIPIGIAYALWSGLGIVLVAIVGTFYYKENLDPPAILGIGLILVGIFIVNIFSKSVAH
jgi:small multidrug resistance pump